MKFNPMVSIIQNSVELGLVVYVRKSSCAPFLVSMDPNLNKTTKLSLSHYIKRMVHFINIT